MAEITSGAAFCWRENCAMFGATFSISTAAYVRSGHAVNTTGASVVVDPSGIYPLTNLTTRQLSQVMRLQCTPAQDTTSGGNSRWYYPTIQLNVSLTTIPGVAVIPYANMFGLLDVNCVYPSLEPNVDYSQGGTGGYYTTVAIDTYSGSAWNGTNYYHKTPGDGSLFDSPRAAMTLNGYKMLNHCIRYSDRLRVGSVRFTFAPTSASGYIGMASNPGTCYLSIGRIWIGDALIIPLGIDAGWKWKPVDSSVVTRSRGFSTYADRYPTMRQLDWTVTGLTDLQAYYMSYPEDANGNQPNVSFGAASLEAGINGEFIVQTRLSGVVNAANGFFGDLGQIYGTLQPPGIEIDDQTSGYAQAMGSVIESR